MTVGFRIKRTWTRVGADVAARFRTIPVANVSDCMARMTAGGPALRPMHASGVMAGPALTVKSRPGDNLMLHKAIDLAASGDIIVCDAGGDLTNSLMGEMMLAHAIKRGIGGFVLNGSIRDRDAFIERESPGLRGRRHPPWPLQGRARRDRFQHQHRRHDHRARRPDAR